MSWSQVDSCCENSDVSFAAQLITTSSSSTCRSVSPFCLVYAVYGRRYTAVEIPPRSSCGVSPLRPCAFFSSISVYPQQLVMFLPLRPMGLLLGPLGSPFLPHLPNIDGVDTQRPIPLRATPISGEELAAFTPFTQFARAAYCPSEYIKDWSCGGK